METKTTNQSATFSAERFMALAKGDLLINKGYYIKLAIALLGIFAAIAICLSINAAITIHDVPHPVEFPEQTSHTSTTRMTYGSFYLMISLWVISIGLTVLGSLTFSNLSSKKSRIAVLMVPASRIEKFTLRLLTYFVGGTVLLIIGFLAGAAICQIGFGAWSAIFFEIKDFFNVEFAGFIAAYGILFVLLGNSLYALGSSIWPKLSWVKTWAVLAVGQWILTIIMSMIFSLDFSIYSFFQFCESNIDTLKWIGLGVLLLLNAGCWAIAWWRYKNTQIIQRFMNK